jgi:peptidyl-prolyl cis-trans isomerase C
VVRGLLLQEAHRLANEAMPKLDSAGRRGTEEEALIRALIEREVVIPERPAGDGSRRNFLVAKQREKAQRSNLAALEKR